MRLEFTSACPVLPDRCHFYKVFFVFYTHHHRTFPCLTSPPVCVICAFTFLGNCLSVVYVCNIFVLAHFSSRGNLWAGVLTGELLMTWPLDDVEKGRSVEILAAVCSQKFLSSHRNLKHIEREKDPLNTHIVMSSSEGGLMKICMLQATATVQVE